MSNLPNRHPLQLAQSYQSPQSKTDRGSYKMIIQQKDSTVFSRLFQDSSNRKNQKDNISAMKSIQQPKTKKSLQSAVERQAGPSLRRNYETQQRISQLKKQKQKLEKEEVKQTKEYEDQQNEGTQNLNQNENDFNLQSIPKQKPTIQTNQDFSQQEIRLSNDLISPSIQSADNIEQEEKVEEIQKENPESQTENEMKIKQSQYYYKIQQLHHPGSLVVQPIQDIPLCYINLKNNVCIPPFVKNQTQHEIQSSNLKIAKKIGKISEAALKKAIVDRDIQKPNVLEEMQQHQQIQIRNSISSQDNQKASINKKLSKNQDQKFTTQNLRSSLSQLCTPRDKGTYIEVQYQRNSLSQKNLNQVQSPIHLKKEANFKSHFSAKVIDQRVQLFDQFNQRNVQSPIQHMQQVKNRYSQQLLQNQRNSFSANPFENKEKKNVRQARLNANGKNQNQSNPIITLHYSQLSPQVQKYSYKDGCDVQTLIGRSQPLEKYKVENLKEKKSRKGVIKS